MLASDFYRGRSTAPSAAAAAAASAAIDCHFGVGMAPIFMPREYVRHDNDNEASSPPHRVSPSSPLRNSIDRRNGSTSTYRRRATEMV